MSESTSRFLAFVLRHHPENIGIVLDAQGWVGVDDLLSAAGRHGHPIDRARLEHVVATNDKRRFELVGDRIRAAQGHSVAIDLGLTPLAPPDTLFHGTVARFVTRIRVEGLVPKNRRHVHLSADIATATAVGARRGEPVILRIAAGEMHTQGYAFYRSTNGVWLTDRVPPPWITTGFNGDDIALVLAAYEAFGRGDIDAAVAGLHPDVDWIEPAEFPNGGAHRGRDAVAACLRASHESWREHRSDVTAHRRGDRILVVHHITGILADGSPQEATVADVFTVRDGLVVHMIAYADPAEAFAAHPV